MSGRKGRSGRRPKDTSAHKLDGTYRPDRHDRRKEYAARPTTTATRPDWITGEARKVWEELGPYLEKLGLLSKGDWPVFASLCVLVAELRWTLRQKKRFVKNADGVERLHQVNTYRLQVIQKLEKLASEFGMTPASWARVSDVALGGSAARGVGNDPEPPEADDGKAKGAKVIPITDRKGRPC